MQILIFTKTPSHRRSSFQLSVIMKGFRSGHRLALLIMRVYKEIALFCSQFSMSLPPWQCGEYRSGATGTHSNTEKMLILTTLLSGRVDFVLFLGFLSPRNVFYLSLQIQNEFISCLGVEIRESIVRQIEKSKFFSVMADEKIDESTKT